MRENIYSIMKMLIVVCLFSPSASAVNYGNMGFPTEKGPNYLYETQKFHLALKEMNPLAKTVRVECKQSTPFMLRSVYSKSITIPVNGNLDANVEVDISPYSKPTTTWECELLLNASDRFRFRKGGQTPSQSLSTNIAYRAKKGVFFQNKVTLHLTGKKEK